MVCSFVRSFAITIAIVTIFCVFIVTCPKRSMRNDMSTLNVILSGVTCGAGECEVKLEQKGSVCIKWEVSHICVYIFFAFKVISVIVGWSTFGAFRKHIYQTVIAFVGINVLQ